jgi:uncharacterized repeat protein (TIGR01451 family)
LTMAGSHVLRNEGSLTWTGGSVYMADTSSVVNAGSFVLDAVAHYVGDQFVLSSGSPSFVNNAVSSMSATATNVGSIGVPLQNDGTISVAAGGSLAISALTNLSGTTLTGGAYAVADGASLHIQGEVVTDAATIALTGSGQITDGSGDALRDLADVTASGALTLSGGRSLTVPGALSSAGSLAVRDSSQLTLSAGALTLTGGQLTGSGTVTADSVSNTGATVAPGDSASASGILALTGTYDQGAGGTLAADINGATAGTGYDRLAVAGAVSLGGTLQVHTGFTPVLGLTFDVVTGASRSGQFGTYGGMTAGGSALYAPSYGATFARLTMSQLPSVIIGDASITEGNAGSSIAHFPVTLSSAATLSVTANYATANGSAIAPSDYISTSGTLTFSPGQTSKTIDVTVNGDTAVEIDETFTVNLSGGTNALLLGPGHGTIVNDDFSADLELAMSTPAAPVVVGQDQTYHLTVTNHGPTRAANVAITDTVAAGASFVAATSDPGCSGSATVTCTLGTLTSGQVANVAITLHPSALGSLANSATVGGTDPDPGPSADTASATVTVLANEAHLSLSLTGPSIDLIGSDLAYSVAVHNAGPVAGSAPVVTETLPAGTTFLPGSSSGGCSAAGTTVTCPIADVAADGDAYLTIHATAPAAPASVTAQATVTSATLDPVTADNTDTVTTNVIALHASAGDDQKVVAGSAVTFDAGGSSPLGEITSYGWDFGDGSTGTGQTAPHAYASPGTYTATLTVQAGALSTTDSAQVIVSPVPVQPGLAVTVRDAASSPLPGAGVAVLSASGQRVSAVTDGSGVAVLQGLADGTYTVAAEKDGYLPDVASGVVVTGDHGTVTVTLQAGKLATTSLTSTPLTRDQIIAAGIDPSDPANQHVYQFEIHLAFRPGDALAVSGYVTGNGFVATTATGGDGSGGGGGGSCSAASCQLSVGGYDVVVTPQTTGGQPTLVYMVIPGKAKFLKEFFSVQMQVSNLAGPAFAFTGGTATISLPPGMSLAPTAATQTDAISLPDIGGGTSATAEWIVRGDTEGFYQLAVDYHANLSPFATPVDLHAETASPVHVWAGAALHMTVDAEDQATDGYPYRVRIGLTNVADVPVYNPSVELLPGCVHCIYAPGQSLERATDVVMPGDTFWSGDFVVIPDITGTLDLSHSFVKKTAGDVDLANSIVSHPALQTPATAPTITATTVAGGVHLSWGPIAGAAGYAIYRAPDRTQDFAGPIATVPVSQTDVVVTGPAGSAFYAVVPNADAAGAIDMRHRVVAGTVNLASLILPSVSVGDVTAVEGDAGTSLVSVPLSLSAPSTVSVTVAFTTVDSTAKAPGDYTAV